MPTECIVIYAWKDCPYSSDNDLNEDVFSAPAVSASGHVTANFLQSNCPGHGTDCAFWGIIRRKCSTCGTQQGQRNPHNTTSFTPAFDCIFLCSDSLPNAIRPFNSFQNPAVQRASFHLKVVSVWNSMMPSWWHTSASSASKWNAWRTQQRAESNPCVRSKG